MENSNDNKVSGTGLPENKAERLNSDLLGREYGSPENKAETLNAALFSAKADPRPEINIPPVTVKPENGETLDGKTVKSVMKSAGLIALAVILAFSGAFYGMYAICRTALFGNSEFLRALIVNASGITVNKAEIDYVSGTYSEDTIALSEKVLRSAVEIKVVESDQNVYHETGAGSGIIISEDGYIVTNYHVISGVTTFNVVLSDLSSYPGTVIAKDSITDVAVVKIEAGRPLTPATFADSDKLEYGQSAIVAGNPLGGGLTVAFGNIAHPNKNIGDESGNFIQVDASVNPGNSGGGLFDYAGNLIGLVTAKASGNNVDGIGYVIPSNRVLSVMNDLMTFGYVKGRPAVGISVVDVNASTWTYFNENDLKGYLYDKTKTGVYIVSSNRYDELKAGDRIISVGGLKIDTKEEVTARIRKYKVGDKLKFTIERIESVTEGMASYQTIEVEIELYERDWAD